MSGFPEAVEFDRHAVLPMADDSVGVLHPHTPAEYLYKKEGCLPVVKVNRRLLGARYRLELGTRLLRVGGLVKAPLLLTY